MWEILQPESLCLQPPHHALGAGNSFLRTAYSLQKHLSPSIFFQPLQESGDTQTWPNVRPCSVLRFWCQTGLPPCWCCKERLSKMCVLLRNTAHQGAVVILLSAIASEWLNPHYEMSLACKNWACFQWMASPRHPSTNKRLCLCAWHHRHPDRNHHSRARHLLAVITPLQRQKVYIQYRLSWPNSFSTYERKATMSVW